MNRLKAVEKEKKRIEGAKNEAEKYLAMQKDISLKKYQLYDYYKHACEQLQSKATEKKVEIEGKINEIKESCKESKTEGEAKSKQKRKLAK